MTQTLPILSHGADPFISHLLRIDPDKPIQSLTRLLAEHGPILELKLPNLKGPGRFIVVGSHALVDELCDEQRFDKRVYRSLETIRAFGLFMVYTEEPNWQKAHNILMPAFGTLPIREMFTQMRDIADHMTRLTLDTIALCAFGTRFNSFYQNEMHQPELLRPEGEVAS